MNWEEDKKTRTFGVEIEMCDFDRGKVTLPDGFEWDEEEMIDNTDAYCSKQFGGEINSSPLLYTDESLSLLNDVLQQVLDAGGRISWMVDIHVHIYAGDLTLEQLKRLVMFEYCTYQYFRKYCKIQEWNEKIFNSKPLISETKYQSIKAAETISELKTILTNNSRKGFIRYAINIASYFVHSTIEFRCFKATEKIDELRNCILGTYRMFYYAISHTEQDFMAINSYEDFVSTIDLPEPIPTPKTPLIYQGNPYHPKNTYVTPPLSFSNRQCAILKQTLTAYGCKRVAIVNAPFFDYELNLFEEFNLAIYNEDPYRHVLYEIAVNDKKIKYCGDLDWLQKHNSDDIVRQLAVALYVYRIIKALPPNNEFKRVTLDSYKSKAEESIRKTESSAKRLLTMFQKAEYHFGNLGDALEVEKNIFFCFGKRYKRTRRAFRNIAEYSDYDTQIGSKRFCYYDLVERLPKDTLFLMFSESPYLDNLQKISYMRNAGIERDSAGLFLYSSKSLEQRKATMAYKKMSEPIEIVIPPDDIQITDPTKLQIGIVPSEQLHELQKRFIKKVDKVAYAGFCFVFKYDNYLLGGCGFDFPRTKDDDLWQITDFCTNNNVPRLSKLILICILSKQLQRMLSRRLIRRVDKVVTYVYTSAPVSMKYRGLYKKNKSASTPSKLVYEGQMGRFETMEDCITAYQKYINDARR